MGKPIAVENSFTGELYLSQSGWLLLSVPNALGQGYFKALHEPGVELPTGEEGRYNAHISVATSEEVSKIGASNITERGKHFAYTLKGVRKVEPEGWNDVKTCWFVEVDSPALEKLRRSYGLSALPKDGKHKFHITFAILRRRVLGANDVSKSPGLVAPPSSDTPTFKLHDKPGVHLIKASSACPACNGPVIDIRGKLVCTKCHRICEGCCEGSLALSVSKAVRKGLEKQSFVKHASFGDAFHSLLEPLVRHWLQSHGMQLGQFHPDRNWADLMENQRFTDFQNEAMRDAAALDSSPLKILHGFNALLGGSWDPSMAAQDSTLQKGYAAIAPYLMRWSPKFWDELHGGTGSVASLANAIAETHRYRYDMTPQEAVQRANGVFNEFYSDPMMHRGFSARELGDIYREAGKRGYIGRDTDPTKISENLAPLVGVASAIRDTSASTGQPLTSIPEIMDHYDKVQAQYPGQRPGALEGYIRTNMEIGRQGGMMSAALLRSGQSLGGEGDPSLATLNAQNEQLTQNARNSSVGRMVGATARMRAEGLIQPGSETDKFLERARAGQLDAASANPSDWAAMVARDSDTSPGAAWAWLQNNQNQRYLTPDLAIGVRQSQGNIDLKPMLDGVTEGYDDTNDPHGIIRQSARNQILQSRGYIDERNFQLLQGQDLTGVQHDATQRGQVAQKTSPYGWHSPTARVVDALKEPNPTLGGIGKQFLNIQPPPPVPTTPPPPTPYTPPQPPVAPKMAMDKQAVGPGFRGIPDRNDMGDLSKLNAGEIIDLIIQRHNAVRAGEHKDLRIGDQQRGLYSWAMRKDMPVPGQKVLANQQPLHTHGYGSFQGTLGPGYGQGTVRRERKGRILITNANPQKIEFTTADTGTPERFVLFKPEGKFGPKQWLLMNNTPTEAPSAEKPHMQSIPAEEVEPFIEQMQTGSTHQAKLDGARSLVKLMKGGVEVLSYRTSKRTGGPITHTERVFGGRPKVDYPKNLEGSTLVGELTTRDPSGKVMPPQTTGGILNSTIENSLKSQKAKGLRLQDTLFDAQSLGKTPIDYATIPYADRRKIIEQVLPYLPKNQFDISEQVEGPEAGKALWRQISSGQNPISTEGMVSYPPVGPPVKAKVLPESDVHLTGTFPGKGKYTGRGVGGFNYALQPGGPTIGEVGTGLDDDLRMQAFQRPADFIGRVARIRSQGQFASGAHRAPALLAIHEDY
jgi:hypothetical protein